MNQVLNELVLVTDLNFVSLIKTLLVESVPVNKLPSQSIALKDTPWLQSSICPRQGPLPLPPLSSNFSDHKYADGQTADTPGLPAPTLCLSFLLAFYSPHLFALCGVSIIAPQLAV